MLGRGPHIGLFPALMTNFQPVGSIAIREYAASFASSRVLTCCLSRYTMLDKHPRVNGERQRELENVEEPEVDPGTWKSGNIAGDIERSPEAKPERTKPPSTPVIIRHLPFTYTLTQRRNERYGTRSCEGEVRTRANGEITAQAT